MEVERRGGTDTPSHTLGGVMTEHRERKRNRLARHFSSALTIRRRSGPQHALPSSPMSEHVGWVAVGAVIQLRYGLLCGGRVPRARGLVGLSERGGRLVNVA